MNLKLSSLILLAGLSASAQTVTFSEHIAPILYANCTPCHRPGEAAPFSLQSYSDVVRRGLTIADQTKKRLMPPWKAEPGWVAYRDERRLTDAQIALIQTWVAQGMQRGDPAKDPKVPEFPSGWTLGTPDLILEMPAGFSVPADGPDLYRNFALPTNVTEDKWVRAVELRATARPVVHHALFFADTTGAARAQDGKDGQPGFPGLGTVFTLGGLNGIQQALSGGLGGWVPGTTPAFLPNGLAYALPKASDFLLQMHFHPNGVAQTEKTQIGLYFGPKPDKTITQIQAPPAFGIRTGLNIPAGASRHLLRGSFTLPAEVDAVQISAHAHYLAKEAKLTATLPSGEVRILLWIKDWDFRWQQQFTFAQPVTLPRGTRLDGELTYDNSEANPNNPNSPPKRVTWGEQSTDEMGSLLLTLVTRTTSELALVQAAVINSVLVTPTPVGSNPHFVSSGLVDGASTQPGTLTPGKIVVLYGERLGPAALVNGTVTLDGRVAPSAGGTQVTFNGVPAPLLYSSAGQVAAVVPYALDGTTGAQVQVAFGGRVSESVALPVVATAPSIFSVNLTGTGQGAVLNQDGVTVNSAVSPAEKGSVISIFSTGEGQTIPNGLDGALALNAQPKPKLETKVWIAGKEAQVTYSGAAPQSVAGLLQVNARIPQDAPSGNVSVEIQLGTAKSATGITVAVK
jgi:uncharacterized protein (TIGR03437 family)